VGYLIIIVVLFAVMWLFLVRPQRRDRAGIHARRFEHRRKPQILRQRDRVVVDAGNVEEYLAAACAGQQSRQNDLGGGAVVGH